MGSADMEAIRSLLEDAKADADSVALDAIDPHLSNENNDVRARALDVLLEIVKDHPERALNRKSVLLDLASDDYIAVRQSALGILGLVVPEHTEEFQDNAGTFIDAVTDPIGAIRVMAANSFAAIASEYPENLAPHADALVEILAEQHDQDLPDLVDDLQDPELMRTLQQHDLEERQKFHVAQEVAANGLVEVARQRPGALEGSEAIVLEATTNTNPTVAGAAIDVLAELIESGYTVPEETTAKLEQALEIDSVFVQARAIRALGLLEATDSIGAIEAIASETPEDDLEELAEETVEWLRSKSDDT